MKLADKLNIVLYNHGLGIKPNLEPIRVELVQEEPVQEEPVQEEPVQEEPVQEEPVQEEPVQEEPVQEEPVKPIIFADLTEMIAMADEIQPDEDGVRVARVRDVNINEMRLPHVSGKYIINDIQRSGKLYEVHLTESARTN